MVFLVAMAHRSLCATISAKETVVVHLRKTIPVKPIAAKANQSNQLK
jgi:hypothetical protein